MSSDFLRTVRAAALVAATTVGAGIFALPFVFERSGFWVSVVFLFVLAALLAVVHVSYFRALRKSGDAANLTSTVQDVFTNRFIRFLAFLSVIGGLLLALSAYLILGAEFLALIFPVSLPVAMFAFWVISAGPLLFRERNLLHTEFLGAAALFTLLILLFGYAVSVGDFSRFSTLALGGFPTPFMAFAPLLFALAGWPAVSEVYAMARESHGAHAPFERGIVWGTMLAAIAYFVFVVAAILISPSITVDALSGFILSSWLLPFVALFGLFALWTSYLPEGLEVKRSMERGLKISPALAALGVVFLPVLFILAGFNQFLSVISLAGGVFIAFQYFFLVRVSRAVLRLRGAKAFLLDLVALFFFAAAIYEIYIFVVG